MISSILYACVLLAALLLAVRNGTQAERRIAIILLLGNLGTIATMSISQGHEFSFVSIVYLLVDIAGRSVCARWPSGGQAGWRS